MTTWAKSVLHQGQDLKKNMCQGPYSNDTH